jgi:hypothetical protein
MLDAEHDPAGEPFNMPTGSDRFNRDVQAPSDARKRELLNRLAEQASGLRAHAVLLGDRIEHLARLAARGRVG